MFLARSEGLPLLLPAFVCLCVIIFGDGFQAIFLKCFVYVGDWPRTATLNPFTLVDFYKINKVLYSTLDIVFL